MRRIFLSLALVACALPAAAAVEFERSDIAAAAAGVQDRGALTVRVPLANRAAVDTLELKRMQVFTADAKIVLHSPTGDRELPIPRTKHFVGQVAGEPRSQAMVVVKEDGEVSGLVAMSGRLWSFSSAKSEALTAREVDSRVEYAHRENGFSCGVDGLGGMASAAGGSSVPADLLTQVFGNHGMPADQVERGLLPDHTARVAIETDQEFLALFGGSTLLATAYVADLMAFNSLVYTTNVETSLFVSHLSLWTTTDPWNQNSTICNLFQFGKYWNDNNASINRTIAHYMSGKSNGGGVAWVGVLCSAGFNFDATPYGCSAGITGTNNWGGAYGYSGDMGADFDPGDPASVVWDMVVTAHEMGHNFNSPHTHCYANVGGNASPVDTCNAGQCGTTGCHCGGASLPAGCPGAGQGCGTIMSYCHLLGGGLSNITMTFGAGHPYGTSPGRVNERMEAHIAAQSGANPSCLSPLDVVSIFANGFESGNVGAWSGSAP